MGYITKTLTHEMVAELRNFCRSYLAFLIDEGFVLSVTPNFDKSKCTISFYSTNETIYGISYTWEDIKNIFIPFLIMLNNEYKILNNNINDTVYYITRLSEDIVDKLISDSYFNNQDKLSTINIYVDFKN